MTQTQPFQDDDLVYVDPKSRKVVSKVEWNEQGLPKSLPMQGETDEGKRGRRAEFYPWGTYRSMKHAFSVEGKRKDSEGDKLTLSEALKKATQEPFW